MSSLKVLSPYREGGGIGGVLGVEVGNGSQVSFSAFSHPICSIVRIIYLSGVESMSLGWGVIRGMGGIVSRGCLGFASQDPTSAASVPI